MATAELFGRLGFFVDTEFLDPETCKTMRTSAIPGDAHAGTVYGGTGEFVVDAGIRQVQRTRLQTGALEQLKAKLRSLTPALEAHFQTELEGMEDPALLTYEAGDFYAVHRDGSEDRTAPEFFRRRQVSIIIFLNSQETEPSDDSYSGGAVIFYGLLKHTGSETHGIDLNGRAGLLVAFRSDVPTKWNG